MIVDAPANVRDYGAVGDGVTDDTAAIRAAIDGNNIVYIPEGTYKVTSTIVVDTTGEGYASAGKIFGEGSSKTVIDNQNSGAFIKVTSGNAPSDFAYGFQISDLKIIDTTTNAGSMGIHLEGTRLSTIENISINGMGSHGIYGLSTVGDYTDCAGIIIRHVEILSCGGWGVFPSSASGGLQYSWNMYQCRIGLNALGGIKLESMNNCVIDSCGIFYNNGTGLQVTKGTGANASGSKVLKVTHCEFDTNDGVQIAAEHCGGLTAENNYIICNNLGVAPNPVFTIGFKIEATASGVDIQGSNPRMYVGATGKVIHQVEAGALDIIVRDTKYSGWSALNGTMYLFNEPTALYDDSSNRSGYEEDTYAVALTDLTLAKVSPTSITGYFVRIGNLVTVTFRSYNNIDTSVFTGTDLVGINLPYRVKIAATSGAAGSCVLTNDGGIASGAPIPIAGSGGHITVFLREHSNSYLTASHLTNGVSDISYFSITYITDQ